MCRNATRLAFSPRSAGTSPTWRSSAAATTVCGCSSGSSAKRRRAFAPGGYLVCEFGFGQEIEVEQIVEASAGLTLVELKRDLQGLARTAVAVRA